MARLTDAQLAMLEQIADEGGEHTFYSRTVQQHNTLRSLKQRGLVSYREPTASLYAPRGHGRRVGSHRITAHLTKEGLEAALLHHAGLVPNPEESVKDKVTIKGRELYVNGALVGHITGDRYPVDQLYDPRLSRDSGYGVTLYHGGRIWVYAPKGTFAYFRDATSDVRHSLATEQLRREMIAVSEPRARDEWDDPAPPVDLF